MIGLCPHDNHISKKKMYIPWLQYFLNIYPPLLFAHHKFLFAFICSTKVDPSYAEYLWNDSKYIFTLNTITVEPI